MCILKCFRYLTFKKNKKKSSKKLKEKNASQERTKSDDKKSHFSITTSVFKSKSGNKSFTSTNSLNNSKTNEKPPRYRVLADVLREMSAKEKSPQKKGEKDNSQSRSIYNTFVTEHFENAQITSHIPYKPLDLAAAFKQTEDTNTVPRSTEEMRGNTLYKVLDDFPNMILPPLRNIDRTLPYLRELNVQPTPTTSPQIRALTPRRTRAFKFSLAATQQGTPVEKSAKGRGLISVS
ncbi:hypothetical protein DICVIV_02628 [Dictyocaulus viviparus]|uniref:Uncharacterized protein n=1 Tax=Dictyocaulus viviparus TaxID=29172 RepID=A0A0D8Y2R4_DICVI|nr:hypothetical protein DICVIV_02628 [Dictyocaulus viviparus]